MSAWRRRLVGLVLATLGLAGCAEFNRSCPVEEGEVWGQLAVDLDIRGELVSHCEAPVGNLVADSMLHWFDRHPLLNPVTGAELPVQVALIHAGAFSDKVACDEVVEERPAIRRGPVTDLDVQQLLSGGGNLAVAGMTGNQLVPLLERSVSSLGQDASGASSFLQIAGELGIEIEVDCTAQEQVLSAEGTEILTPGERIGSVCIGQSEPCFTPEGRYYVVVPELLTRNDHQGIPVEGFIGFHQEGVVIMSTGVPVVEAVREWLSNQPGDRDYPAVEGRYQLTGCGELGCPVP